MTAETRTNAAELEEQHSDTIDFKMVTFSLGGKDYGVDIMNIKEIARADKFTYMPNSASFVRGVYNLRGDIIPIVDLRLFFHLPDDQNSGGLENLLILRVEDRVYGIIVDRIDKVVGINSARIQPPHPLFGDINIKYISGVVENTGDLYIILDVIRIFTVNQAETISVAENAPVFAAHDKPHEAGAPPKPSLSPDTGRLWKNDYAALVKNILPDLASSTVQVWNLGCGKGYETYSFACILKARYPKAYIKIWANDSDIMAISQAPNMVFDLDDVPDYCRPFLIKCKAGHCFNQAVRDSIVFEYHDVLRDNHLPGLDFILARDFLSSLALRDQAKLAATFAEKLKPGGLVFLGQNEVLAGENWQAAGKDPVYAFRKESL